jgi:spermidine synthase
VLKKFPLLFVVLLIEGGALMAVELTGAKLVAPFYGNSLYVWTSVLAITVLGLTLGYYAGGRLSRQPPIQTTLFIILGISALLVLALPLTASISIALTKGMGLLPGICVTCVLLLLPPMLCFGIVGPMVVSLMSSQLETVGKTAGTVYFTSTSGGIAVTFFFGLYFIPVAGLTLGATITGLALAWLPLIYIIKRALGARKRRASSAFKIQCDKPISTTAKRLKVPAKQSAARRRPGLPAPANGAQRTVYLFAVLEGASVMAVELISARMVAPYFGSSLYVWTTVIGFTLFALAIGYFAGGVAADKHIGPDTLYWILLIASLFLMLMHVSAQWLTMVFVNVDPGIAVILVSLLLILPPLVFMGMVPTFLIRKISKNADTSGANTGIIYAISSASGIVALLLLGFFIIPRYGLTTPSIITGLAVGLVPFANLIARKNYASLLFVFVALFSFWAIKTQRPGKDVEVRYYSEGLLGQLLVADVSTHHGQKVNDRVLFVNRIGQTYVDKATFSSRFYYPSYSAVVCSRFPQGSDALVLGLGGGSIANAFQTRLGFNVDAVELDQRVAELAREQFSLSNKVNVIVDDARHYLEQSKKKYDVILFDVYRGESPAPHIFTIESLEKTKSLLKESGLIVVNFNGFLEGKAGQAARSLYKTLIAAGLETSILPTPGAEENRTILFIASRKKQDFHALRAALTTDGQTGDIEPLFYDAQNLSLNDAVVLTDDKPILDLLNIRAGNAMRKDYMETTKRFYEEGVPLFW